MAKGIFWLASYPKSGNTWFRAFLKNLLEDSDKPVSINNLSIGHDIASSIDWISRVAGFDIDDLNQQEINHLRPYIYEWEVNNATEYCYHKIHDACWQLNKTEWLVSAKATAGALYFIRNPLDVAISYANYKNTSIDKIIKGMNNPKFRLGNNKLKLNYQTEQRLLTWSKHVTSWVDNPDIDTYAIRYEDMKYHAQKTFTAAAAYLKLPTVPHKIEKALRFSDFKILQSQENNEQFLECPKDIDRFFRKGIAGEWQQVLTTKQIDQIINDHHVIMSRFGYLDGAGNPKVM